MSSSGVGITGKEVPNSHAYSQFIIHAQHSQNTLLWIIIGFAIYHLLVLADLLGSSRMLTDVLAYSAVLGLTVFTFSCLFIVWIWRCQSSEGNNADNFKMLPALQASNPVLMAVIHASIAMYVLYSSTDIQKTGTSIQLNLAMAMLRIYPISTYLLLRDTWWQAIGLSLGIGLCTCFSICFYLNRADRVVELLTYSISAALVLPDSFKQDRDIFQLVTQLRAALKENETLTIAAQALELRAMIGNVAHDLKTPLTSFLGGIEYMREVVVSWDQQLDTLVNNASTPLALLSDAHETIAALRDCFTRMENTNCFMTMTINRLLDYTKSYKGVKLLPKFETICLQDEITLAAQIVCYLHCTTKMIIAPLSPDICSHIITDKQWLVENLLCLLSNAAKYAAKGNVDVNVLLQPAEAGGEPHLRFEVQDTGIGLSEEAMVSLFAPFKQAQRLAGGTGLGLYSLAVRVDALHGQYGVSKRPDGAQGSLFWFTIPYRPDALSRKLCIETTVNEQQGRTRELSLGSTPTKPMVGNGHWKHVLVVDDAPMIVKMTSMLLQRKGHSVQHAVNGAEALEKIQQGCDDHQRPFDVVLMDLQMPVLDGIEAIRRLRRNEDARDSIDGESQGTTERKGEPSKNCARPPPHQFVIALSANSDEGTKHEALAAGADAFIDKPFTYETFQSVLAAKQ